MFMLKYFRGYLGHKPIKINQNESRHTVVCQRPRKQKRRAAHKCVIYWYCKVAKFSLLYLQNYYADLNQIYIFSALHTHHFTYQN